MNLVYATITLIKADLYNKRRSAVTPAFFRGVQIFRLVKCNGEIFSTIRGESFAKTINTPIFIQNKILV
jgi:hypothetical protein